MTCGESPGSSPGELVDLLSWGEVEIEICPDESWERWRPVSVHRPSAGGLPTVLTGATGGRVYTLVLGVTSDDAKDDLEELLSGAYVVYTPALRESGTFAVESLLVRPQGVPHCWIVETTIVQVDPAVI